MTSEVLKIGSTFSVEELCVPARPAHSTTARAEIAAAEANRYRKRVIVNSEPWDERDAEPRQTRLPARAGRPTQARLTHRV